MSLGMSILYLIGCSVIPAIAGIYMQINQVFLKSMVNLSLPAIQSYNTTILTAALVSAPSIDLAIVLKRIISDTTRVVTYNSRVKKTKIKRIITSILTVSVKARL
jgi:hypothetical protein